MAAQHMDENPPAGARLTAYDREHLWSYLRLLDAEAAGATWQEVVYDLFKLDPASDSERLQRMHAANLARVRSGCEAADT